MRFSVSRPTAAVLAIFAVTALSTLSLSCAGGPARPSVVDSPDSPVLIDPILRGRIGLPETKVPVTATTADGRMQFVFHLQNQTERQLRLQYEATFYDAAGVPVDEQRPRSEFLSPQSIRTFSVTANALSAKTVTVQVRPAQ